MSKTVREWIVYWIAVVLLFAFVSCNAGFVPTYKSAATDKSVRSTVSRIIDEELDYVKPYLDADLQQQIDEETSRSPGGRGARIVDLTMGEERGVNYVDFCYSVNQSNTDKDTSQVLQSAKSVLTAEEYQKLKVKTDEIEKQYEEMGRAIARDLPESQKEAFYEDLKVLVVRTVVLLVAGIVYMIIPDVVFWGKISAAAAIAIGAGMVALAAMTIYQHYEIDGGNGGDGGEKKSFTDWLKSLYEIPAAEYALTTAAVSLGTTLNMGPVVTGIIICLFAVYNAWDLIEDMMKTYDFDAR
ncbi:MAG: hypothetical protein MJ052_03190 [Sphaerochaetaceae bacterium]|nr:hypothetical protein [Sphaerochaetaceae bacterium]